MLFISGNACRTANPVARENFAWQYQKDDARLHPKYAIHCKSDSIAKIYFRVPIKELLFVREANNEFAARILIRYILHPVASASTVSDSGHVVQFIPQAENQIDFLGELDMHLFKAENYFVEITLRDLNKSTVTRSVLHLNNQSANSVSRFMLTEAGNETPLFAQHVSLGKPFSLRYASSAARTFHVSYFKTLGGPAPPPFAYLEQPNAQAVADSTFMLSVDEGSPIQLNKRGRYLLKADSSLAGGFTICVFYDGFPEVITAENLLLPLRYMTAKNEYNKMASAADVKLAVDEFWLNNSGSEERARVVIRQFYNRVEEANRLFSAQAEGWKTDRGMFYVIFGPPQGVYRSSDSETWYYGDDLGANTTTGFTFQLQKNTGCAEDFYLMRNMTYNAFWTHAVDTWRQGRVFSGY
ncbi:MAG: GWxTD domain-containing protein [Bacteroidia bacterium]